MEYTCSKLEFPTYCAMFSKLKYDLREITI